MSLTNPGYISALTSGYILMGANMLIQFALTPYYLSYLGEHQFGVLMILLNLINFASLGITWMSGGLVRVIGEYWSHDDHEGFRLAFAVGKYAFTIYAILVVTIGICLWFLLQRETEGSNVSSHHLLMAGLYLILSYEALPERQAFVGTNRQETGNYIEVSRIMLFALITYILLPIMKSMSAVWIALMVGVLMQRILMGVYWSRQVGNTGWMRYRSEMRPLLRRLAFQQGMGYVSYGILLLILQADTAIVGFLGGAEEAGKFVLLWKIPEAIGLLLWKIPSTLEPRVINLDARGNNNALKTLFIQGRRWYLLLVVFISAIYVVVGKRLAELWVGDHALDQNWLYLVAGAALFFNTFARWPIAFAHALVELKPLVRVAAIEVIGKLLLILILYPLVGIAAPLVSIVLVHICYVFFAYQGIVKRRICN